MFNFFIDTIIWTFSIYGFLNFVREFWVDIACYILELFIKLKKKIIILKK